MKLLSKHGEIDVAIGDDFYLAGIFWSLTSISDVNVPSRFDPSGTPLINCAALESADGLMIAGEVREFPGDLVASQIALTRALNQFTLIPEKT